MRYPLQQLSLILPLALAFVSQLSETKAESSPDRGEALQIKKAYRLAPAESPRAEAPDPKNQPVQPGDAQLSAEGERSCTGSCSDIHSVSPVPSPSATGLSMNPSGPNPSKSAAPPVIHLIDEAIPEALESFYSKKLTQLTKKWPPENIEKNWESLRPVWIRGIKTEGKSLYVGTQSQMLIHANLKKVSALIEDFESYPTFFHDLKFVRVIAKDGNKFTTRWERYSPLFFIPNIKYEQVYIAETTEKRVAIRYQLKSADAINFADGYLVLDAEGESTRLTTFDFFDANWGILGGLAPGKIWHESLQNVVKDDIALKTHAEHPDWSRDQIFRECDRILDLFPVEPIQYVDPPNWASY